MDGLCRCVFLAEPILRLIYIRFYHRANNRGKYIVAFFNSMIDNKDGHISLPLILFTCTTLCHVLLEWQKNIADHLKASKSKLNADRLDCSNYFNHKNDGCETTSCSPVTSRKWLTSPGIGDMSIISRNTWNTLQESNQQRVYKNTLATVKREIQQGENPMPAIVICVEAAHVENAILC
jgi:hypothetical protein